MPRKIDRVSVCVLSPARGLLTSEGNHFGVCASNFCALAGLRGCLRGYGGNPNLRHDCEHSDTDALTTRVRKLALRSSGISAQSDCFLFHGFISKQGWGAVGRDCAQRCEAPIDLVEPYVD
eukprot:1189738-Prorocentrum_minimum.AAC.4